MMIYLIQFRLHNVHFQNIWNNKIILICINLDFKIPGTNKINNNALLKNHYNFICLIMLSIIYFYFKVSLLHKING